MRKIFKWSVLAGLVWFSYHMFVSNFNVVHQDGIYGIVSEARWHEITEQKNKATTLDSIPDYYWME